MKRTLRSWLFGALCLASLIGCHPHHRRPDPAVAGQAPFHPPQDSQAHALRTLEGRASYYHDRYQGRRTANGEQYDRRAFTAASRNLAFGTRVRVIRVDTGAHVIVRINDRGPFGDRRRILDLSRAAAEALDMIRAGVVRIRAEIIEEGS